MSSALDSGGHGLSNVPVLLKRLLAEEGWREFETVRGEVVRHERFEEFVAAPPLKGLGAEISLIKRIVADDREAVDLLDQALQGKHGGDRSKGVNHPLGGERRDRTTKHMRRLRKDFPELHEAVLNGQMSVYTAAVEAGIYPKRATINLTDPVSAARTLRTKASPEFLAELRRLLDE